MTDPQITLLELKGAPEDIAAQLWFNLCLPALDALEKEVSRAELARFYEGFQLALLASMKASFGFEPAVARVRTVLERVARVRTVLERVARFENENPEPPLH